MIFSTLCKSTWTYKVFNSFYHLSLSAEEYNRVNRGRKIFVKTKSSLFENRNFCSKLFIINLLGKWTKPIWRLKFQNKFQKLKKSGSIDVFSITAQFIREFCTKLEIYFNLGKKIKINWRNCSTKRGLYGVLPSI